MKNGFIIFQKVKDSVPCKEIPSLQLITQTLSYARELERIVWEDMPLLISFCDFSIYWIFSSCTFLLLWIELLFLYLLLLRINDDEKDALPGLVFVSKLFYSQLHLFVLLLWSQLKANTVPETSFWFDVLRSFIS